MRSVLDPSPLRLPFPVHVRLQFRHVTTAALRHHQRTFRASHSLMAAAAAAASLAAGAVATWQWHVHRKTVPEAFVLRLEAGSDATVCASSGNLTNEEAAMATFQAAGDRRCRGLLLRMRCEDTPRVGSGAVGRLGRAQELRDAVLHFRNAPAVEDKATHKQQDVQKDSLRRKRPTIAYGEHFGGFGDNGTLAYYLASACEQMYVQPGGSVALLGISQPRWYAKELLEKYGVKPRVVAKGLYKSAGDVFGRSSGGRRIRRAAQSLVNNLRKQVESGIAYGRGWKPEKAKKLLAKGGILDASKAVQDGLLDGELYWDEVQMLLPKDRKGIKPLPQVGALEYLNALQKEKRYKKMQPKIALVFLKGAILLGRGRDDGISTGSDGVCAALRAAGEDKTVGAVVLRLDSPGGSPGGSIAIEREIHSISRKGKPVIASMADVAASGAYLIAAACSHVSAQPGTITGSIGTLAAKFDIRELMQRHGVHVETSLAGRDAEMFSIYTGWSRSQKKMAVKAVESAYVDFCGRVARGRKMSTKQVSGVAEGRVFTGVDALQVGLIDSLGGLHHSVDLAMKQAGMPSTSPVVVFAPVTRLSLEALLSALRQERPWGLFSRCMHQVGFPSSVFPGLLPLADLFHQDPIQHLDLTTWCTTTPPAAMPSS